MTLDQMLELKMITQPRIVRRTAADALKPQPPIEYIVAGIISRGSVCLFYGEPGSKKTYSMLSMAVCVAMGHAWLDMPTRSSRVLIIDEESGNKRLSLRLASALRGEMGGEDTPIEYITLAGFYLDDATDVVLLENEIIESGADLVIFDALADIMTGDENSKEHTQPIFNAFRRPSDQTGAALVVIHHSNKLGGYRGSSAIKGAVDLMVSVASQEGSEYVNFKSEKNRDGEAISWAGKCVWTKDPDAFSMFAAAKQKKPKTLSKSQEYVIRYLKEHGASELPAIMGAVDLCSPEAARKAVFNLAHLQMINRTNPGEFGRGVSAIYDLVKEENQDE